MSRNFELLQKIGQQQAFFETQSDTQTILQEPLPVASSSLSMSESELEELTKLVQRVFMLPGNDAPHMVAFMATESGNGGSFITARVADVLASHVGATICIADANLRNPGVHSQFGVDNSHGLADALRHSDPIRAFARPTSRNNLWLLTAGSSPEDAQSLLASDRMRLRMSELRADFDYVLIDCPAMNVSNDGIALGSSADGVIVVLKANTSRRETARQALQEIQNAKTRVIGAVLNQRTYPIPDSIYKKL